MFKNKKEKPNKDSDEPIFHRKEIATVKFETKEQLLEAKEDSGFREETEDTIEQPEDGLIDIYKDRNGHLPNMSRLERRKRSGFKIFLKIFFVLVIIGAALAGGFYYIINKAPVKFTGERIKLEIESPKESASGEEITYLVKYTNQEDVFLKNVELTLRYPEGFVFREAEPYPLDENNNSWKIGTLLRGRSGEIKITGQLIGEIDSTQTLSALLSFWPENFNAEFQELASSEAKITSSILKLTLEGPDQILAGSEAKFILKYKNVSKEDLNDLRITLEYPEDFNFNESEPQATRRDNIWFIDKLESESEKEIVVQGDFLQKVNGAQELKVEVALRGNGEDYQVQQEKNFITNVVEQDLALNLIINGSTENQAVDFGETLNYTIVYKNSGSSILKNIEITANLESDILDWFTLKDSQNGQVEDHKIIWTKDQISRLAYLDAGEEGVIDFEINLNINPEESETNDYKINNLVKAKIGEIGDFVSNSEVESNSIINEVSSSLELKTQGRYYNESGAELGSGPLPPKVEETTTYKIFWYLSNGIHEVKDVIITTTLPDYISGVGDFSVSAGEINYDEASGQITWIINRLPAKYTGLEASFKVAVKPTKDDVDKLLILVSSTNLSAVDKVTERTISVLDGIISTDLVGDSYAKGQGIVGE